MSSKNFRELKKCDKNPVREQVQVMYWKFEKTGWRDIPVSNVMKYPLKGNKYKYCTGNLKKNRVAKNHEGG